jgi:hypothetical protein
MRHTRSAVCTLLLALAAALSGCSSDGGGGGTTPDGGTTAGSAVSKGVVTSAGAGSVVVNGITFSTSASTAVKIDDNPSAANLLKPGMVVKVTGSSDAAAGTGIATEIEARDALEGTISAVGANTITVMGQTVRIEDNVTRLNDDDTVKTFASAAFAPGQIVEVHGFADDNGGLRATRAAKKASGEFEVKGFVTSTGATFGLALTPGGAPVLNVTGTLPTGAIVGSPVEVKAGAAPSGGAVTATSVKLEDKLGAAGEKVEVEGIVASGDVNSFVVNGQQVTTSPATVFEGGLKTDFATGIKVEAEGPLNANGVILAARISFRSNIKIEGNVSGITSNSLQVLGKTVVINPAPMTRQDLINNVPIATGDHVEVHAQLGSDGTTLVASRIRVKNPDTRAFLQGPVTVASGTMAILGSTITTNATTEFRISSDSSETAVTQAAFLAQLKTGVTVVKVRWASGNTALAVEQAEIQLGK